MNNGKEKGPVDYPGVRPERERLRGLTSKLYESKVSLDKQDFIEVVKYHKIESLILAQDERWRRA